MSLLERVALFAQHGDVVERARNPDTGKPFPSPTVGVKILAWFARTSWAKRQVLKWIMAGSAALSAWLLAHGGSDEQSTAITAGTVAAFTFFYEQAISWLCNKAKISLPDFLTDDDVEPPVRGLTDSHSPFAPARPSVFAPGGIAAALHPMTPMTPDDPPTAASIAPKPRASGLSAHQRPAPLGAKGCVVIAEPKEDQGGDVEGAPTPRTQIRGTLRCEADDGGLVILDTTIGIQSLERSKYHFYPRAEE
ncbi:MAG: hypothetical protein KA004_17385 [Verrucomicrobiales bacterium]|nr:hypothetical protein [Verrucomicrobiales bacterium]